MERAIYKQISLSPSFNLLDCMMGEKCLKKPRLMIISCRAVPCRCLKVKQPLLLLLLLVVAVEVLD